MEHKHKYDAAGKQLCCTLEEKINAIANKKLDKEHKETVCCATDEPNENEAGLQVGYELYGIWWLMHLLVFL